MKKFLIRKVAVLGAGVMGAQIAAHLVNVRVPVVLFDLPDSKTPNKNGIVSRAVDQLRKLKPSPLGVSGDAELIQQANYEEHMSLLGECDLVIEAIAERMDWKRDLYEKKLPHMWRLMPSWRPTRRACRSRRCLTPCPNNCVTAFVAFTSSIRRAT